MSSEMEKSPPDSNPDGKVDLEDLSNKQSSWIPVKNTVTRKHFVIVTAVALLASFVLIAVCVGTAWGVYLHNELHKSRGCPVATSEFNYTELVQVLDDMSARTRELELHVESQQETLNHTQELLKSATIKIASLESELSTVTAAFEGLETTKASKSEVDSLSNNFTFLVSQKADKTELASLASNLSTLAATTVHKTYFEIWVVNITAEVREIDSRKADRDEVARLAEDLATLAASALNVSHYDQLSSDIDMLAMTTASNVSSLREGIETLNETKTPRADFISLVLNVTAISNTKVDKTDFDSLVVTVRSLEATKADQTSLTSLEDNVSQLAATAAKQSDLHALENTVTSHINSATTTQNQLSSKTDNIDNKVRANSDDINHLSHNIDNLQTQVDAHSSSAHTFPPQWAIVLLLTLTCLWMPYI